MNICERINRYWISTDQSAICYSLMIVPSWADEYQSLIFFGGNYIYPLGSESEKLRKAHDEAATMMIRSSLTILAAITLSSLVFAMYPMYTYIFENAHPMTIPIVLPFLDPDTSFGYYLNVANQLFISFIGIFGNIGIEFISSMMVNNIWIGVSSVQCALDEFSEFVKQKPNATLDMKYRLRTILMQIRDLDRWILCAAIKKKRHSFEAFSAFIRLDISCNWPTSITGNFCCNLYSSHSLSRYRSFAKWWWVSHLLEIL